MAMLKVNTHIFLLFSKLKKLVFFLNTSLQVQNTIVVLIWYLYIVYFIDVF